MRSSICTINDSGAEANTSASSSPDRKATVAGVCSSADSLMASAAMLFASNSLAISAGTPLPAVPTFSRRPASCGSELRVPVASTFLAASSR